jgi:hypothetical protein
MSVERGGDATVNRGSNGPEQDEGLGLQISPQIGLIHSNHLYIVI